MNFMAHSKIEKEKLTKPISFKIDCDTEAKLIALANEKEWSVSHFVRNIVCEYVKNLE
jgi:hypothetical protein